MYPNWKRIVSIILATTLASIALVLFLGKSSDGADRAEDIAPECDSYGQELTDIATMVEHTSAEMIQRLGGLEAFRAIPAQAEVVKVGEYSKLYMLFTRYQFKLHDLSVCLLSSLRDARPPDQKA